MFQEYCCFYFSRHQKTVCKKPSVENPSIYKSFIKKENKANRESAKRVREKIIFGKRERESRRERPRDWTE